MVRIMPGYRFYIHTLLLCLNLIWLSEAGLAQAPDPAKWLKEVREKGVTGDTGVVPNRVVMIRKIYKKKPPKLQTNHTSAIVNQSCATLHPTIDSDQVSPSDPAVNVPRAS